MVWRRLLAFARRGGVPLVVAVVVLLAGVSLSATAQSAVRTVQLRNAASVLDRRAAAAGSALSSELLRYQNIVTQLAAGMSGKVTPDLFAQVTAPVSEDALPGASGVSFAVATTDSDVAAVQATWRRTGATSLTFRPIGHGPHIFTVFSRSLDGGPVAPGRDASPAPAVMAAFDASRESGRTTISDTLFLLKDSAVPSSRRQLAFVLVCPVYAPGVGPATRGAFIGWVVMSLRARSLTATTLDNSTQGLVHATLTAPRASGTPVLVAAIGPSGVPAQPLTRTVMVTVAQQRWRLTLWDTTLAQSLDAGYGSLATTVLVGGSAFTLLLAFLVWVLLTSRRRALHRVAIATTELRLMEAEARKRADDLGTANRDLVTARDAATVASQAKSDFLSTMSHEIRTPMNAVIGLTEIVLDGDLDAQQREHLETVRASGDALISLINDILDWSKIESGHLVLESRPFSVRDCVADVAQVLGSQVDAEKVELAVHVDPACPATVVGDVSRLQQILLNLVGNAIKFTEAGRVVVTVAATPLERPPAEVGSQPQQDSAQRDSSDLVTLRFAVADTGIGIGEHMLHRLFQDFSQIDTSTTRSYGGTGLGLAISQRLARAMRGTITVASELGVGSTFTLDVPFEQADPRTSPSAIDVEQAPIPPDGQSDVGPLRARGRVLLVEDNKVNRTVARLMLSRLGYEADESENGAQAELAARRGDYPIIVMDVQMPVMDGLEATRRLRRDPPPGRRPWIIGLTANALADDRDACLEAGMDDFLSKPIRRDQLAEALAAVDVGV